MNRQPYETSSRVQTMGPGGTTARVTLRFEYIASEEGSAVVNFMQYMISDVEFERFLPTFKYWKMRGIKLIIPPRLVATNTYSINSAPGRIALDWNSDFLENIAGDDSAKQITSYNSKNKIYKFKPPNALLQCANGKQINLREWISTNTDLQNTIPPGFIKITAPWSFFFIIEAIIKFRGNQTNNAVNLIKIKGKKSQIVPFHRKPDPEPEEEIKEEIKEEVDNEEEKEEEEEIKEEIKKKNNKNNKNKNNNKI